MLTADRVLAYRNGRIGMCLVAAMIYIALTSVDRFVPDWSEDNQCDAGAEVVKDAYDVEDDEVCGLGRVLRDLVRVSAG